MMGTDPFLWIGKESDNEWRIGIAIGKRIGIYDPDPDP